MENKKIDLYYNGDYLCSTNQSKTCKAAVKKYLEHCFMAKHSLAGASLIQEQIIKNPKLLKARFDRNENK